MRAARRRATEAVRRASHEPWWPLRRNRSGRWGRALASAWRSQRSRNTTPLGPPRADARFRAQPRAPTQPTAAGLPGPRLRPASARNHPWYAPRPLRATDRGVDDDTRAARLPDPPRPGRRAGGDAAANRDRAGVEGPAAAVGPLVSPDVLVPRELPGGPRPRLHRPLLAPRRRRPRPVLGPRHDPASGVGRGPDRCRQRPQPVRSPPHRVEGRA